MRRYLRLVFMSAIGLGSLVSHDANAMSPAINCKKAATTIETTICQSPEFIAMDREIAALYDRGLASLPAERHHPLALSQIAFIKQRSGCAWASHHSAHPGPAINECIRDKMENRLRSLHNMIDRGGAGSN